VYCAMSLVMLSQSLRSTVATPSTASAKKRRRSMFIRRCVQARKSSTKRLCFAGTKLVSSYWPIMMQAVDEIESVPSIIAAGPVGDRRPLTSQVSALMSSS